MSEATLEKQGSPPPEETSATAVAPPPPEKRRGGKVLSREMWSMLVVPPVMVAIAFIAFVIEAQQLRWSELQLRTLEHIGLTVVSAILVVVIAVPLGILLTRGRARRAAPVVVGIANAGQAAPSVGLIVLLFIWFTTNPPFGLVISGQVTAVIALTLYGLLPVLRNTIVGIQGVDPTLVEAEPPWCGSSCHWRSR